MKIALLTLDDCPFPTPSNRRGIIFMIGGFIIGVWPLEDYLFFYWELQQQVDFCRWSKYGLHRQLRQQVRKHKHLLSNRMSFGRLWLTHRVDLLRLAGQSQLSGNQHQ